MTMKTLPIGLEDFEQVSGKHYYVDKTRMIKDIIDYHFFGQSVLFMRPSKFGKSLTLSMLECFFSNKKDSKHLFADKSIASEEGDHCSHMNAYPVIFLRMSNLTQSSYEEMLDALAAELSTLFRYHDEVLECDLHEMDAKEYEDIVHKRVDSPWQYTHALILLGRLLYQRYRQKAIILIDDFDKPLEYAYRHGFYKEASSLFRSIYLATLKGNDYAKAAFVTGTLQIRKESLSSDLNNLVEYGPIHKQFQEYFGFLEHEVLDMMRYCNVQGDIDELRQQYGGYGEDGSIYNPWSILNYIQNKRIDRYFANDESNKAVKELLDEDPHFALMLNEFVGNESMLLEYNWTVSYPDVREHHWLPFSYLVHIGYLTAKYIGGWCTYLYSFPNREIQLAFENDIIGRNLEQHTLEEAKALRDAVLSGAEGDITDCLKKYVDARYRRDDEKAFLGLAHGIMGILFNHYVIRLKTHERFAQCDITLSPKRKQGVGIVIEIRQYKGKLSKNRLDSSAIKALDQIETEDYDDELARLGATLMLHYAFIFDDKGSYVKAEKRKC